jgi:hypothetical protein
MASLRLNRRLSRVPAMVTALGVVLASLCVIRAEGADQPHERKPEVTAEWKLEGETARLTVKWSGAAPNDLIAVAIDSSAERAARVESRDPEGVRLHGIVLFRAAGRETSETVRIDPSALKEILGPGPLTVSIHLASRAELLLLRGSPFVLGGERVGEVVMLPPSACAGGFRYLPRGESAARLGAVFPGADALRIADKSLSRSSPLLRDKEIRARKTVEAGH